MTSDTPARRRARVFSRRRGAPSRARRRLGAAVRMLAALVLAGGVYTAFTPGAFAEDNVQLSAVAREGKALYDTSCISCHGRDGQGVEERGPSLIGVGSASVEFQVGTGRMPMTRQEAQAEEKPRQFDDAQTEQLGQYIQELGGGPELPEGALVEDLEAKPDALARGGELFRVNCTSCHGFGGGGGALSSGKFAPALHDATAEEIYAAMLTGPQNMPVFGDNQLTPDQKKQIITYISVQLQDDKDPGGLFNLGRYGPSTEGMAIFLVGITLLVFTSLWIAGKS
ncbi:cytochrome bc1 complex diheme cytochrome c subunit [Actinoplanes xinjiangensis]|jgi:ubiquinol-cytochrome c reductase cytochrome c subunit|uniref:Cytochrome bc1 complex cytochrome c subunit n=1 Tax=Actinoplanes xinjiangensis TaxID=512350 RepID=A0A316FNI4_9ACTN|nr:cytochrome c [Actinoplanes xinjiangensis]PWK49662.1 menaquinol-cytochrome c reductase cytochrome c1 subunit precursor [Actinoplanes xinjiangensis]GIF37667.1 putative ubiquinol-cytochrome c reductase cytochrome c subunit [Actinoplanes xinjiangensis]